MKGCVSDAFVDVWEDRWRGEQERTARAVSLSHRAAPSREEEEKQEAVQRNDLLSSPDRLIRNQNDGFTSFDDLWEEP